LTLKDNRFDDLFLCATLTGCRGGNTPFVQEGAEVAKPDPRCSWEDQSGRVGAGVRDKSMESRKVVQPLHLPLMICPCAVLCTYVVVG